MVLANMLTPDRNAMALIGLYLSSENIIASKIWIAVERDKAKISLYKNPRDSVKFDIEVTRKFIPNTMINTK